MKKLVIVFLMLAACSTPYKKALLATVTGATAGAVYGSSRPDYQTQNSMMYGALGGLVVGATALLIDLDNLNPEKLKSENERLKTKLDDFQRKLEPQLVAQGRSLFSSPLPKEVSGLIEPGEWRRYKMDQWVQDPNQQNIWYRQIEMFEITPPASR